MASRDNNNLAPHPSLPARPPPSSYSAPPVRHNNTNNNSSNTTSGARGNPSPPVYGGFTPRSVVAHAPPHVSAAPAMYSQASVSAPYQSNAYATSNTYYNNNNNSYPAYASAGPTSNYPAAAAAAAGPASRGHNGSYDPEEEARIAEWNSAYNREDANIKKPGNTATGTRADVPATPEIEAGTTADGKRKTVVRQGGGKSWEDSSLLEWDPLHPRLFIGNLAGEVTDDSLLKAFSKYPSVSKARVIRDKRTTKSKSYGFVSFANTDDYFRAAKDMNGKYVGSHPIQIKRATAEVKATTKRDDRHNKHGKYNKKNNNTNRPKAADETPAVPVVAFIPRGVQKKGKSNGPRVLG